MQDEESLASNGSAPAAFPLHDRNDVLVALNRTMLILELDREGIVVGANALFLARMGYRLDELCGQPHRLICSSDAPAGAHDAALWDRLRRGEAFSHVVARVKSDGTLLWLDAFYTPIMDADGVLERVIKIANDVTDEVWHRESVRRVLNGVDASGSAVAISNPGERLVYASDSFTKIYEVLHRRILQAVFDDQPIEGVMALLCSELVQLAPELLVAVVRCDEDRSLHALAAPGLPPSHLDALRLFCLETDAEALRTVGANQRLTLADIAGDGRWSPHRAWLSAAGLTGCGVRPIGTGGGRIIGLLAFFLRDGTAPDAFHRRLMDVGLHLCSLAMERESVRARMRQLAYYDDLTGLPNRSHLHTQAVQAVDDAIRRNGAVALLIVDIDRFKHVNENFGQSAGDALLREIARRLRAVLRGGDIVGRMSGDEFLVVLPQCDVKGIDVVTRHLVAELTRAFDVGPAVLRPTASVGVSFFPDNGHDLPTLLRHADMAMVQAKADGRDCVRFFSVAMNQVSQERHALEGALRQALENEGLQLHYQPQIRMRDGVLYGVEALARWRHPVLGDLPPARFVPLAEACGLIDMLGEWAIRTACRQLADWRARDIAVPSVSVNLSPTNFHSADLERHIEHALQRYDLVPSDLTLEITESVLLDSNPDTMDTIARLTASGIRLSMDDFGTGYSSLGHLRRLSVQELKLDRSFVVGIESDAPSRALASAIVRIGESLDLTVVAEGVETEAQRHFLAELGCEAVQGYLYAPALPAGELEHWLAQRAP